MTSQTNRRDKTDMTRQTGVTLTDKMIMTGSPMCERKIPYENYWFYWTAEPMDSIREE